MKKKYFWLKLDRNFFKRHDMRIIEGMDNGKDYLLFYLKLLLESIDHEGELRFSDLIPYDSKMLSIITNTNVDIVKNAIKIFQELKMMEMYDDGTIYMKEVKKMLGEASSTHRVQALRERQKQSLIEHKETECNVTVALHETEKEKEKDIEQDKKKTVKEKKAFIPPTLEDIQQYCLERKNNIDPKRFYDYFTEMKWIDSEGKPVRNWKGKMITWENKSHDSKMTNGKVEIKAPDWLGEYMEDLKKMEG